MSRITAYVERGRGGKLEGFNGRTQTLNPTDSKHFCGRTREDVCAREVRKQRGEVEGHARPVRPWQWLVMGRLPYASSGSFLEHAVKMACGKCTWLWDVSGTETLCF